MSHVGLDLLDFAGQSWLVMVDRFSGFPFPKRLSSTTTSSVVTELTNWFMDFGWPSYVRSDEAAVKSIKLLLLKCAHSQADFRTALFEWRNAPRSDGYSPAQMFFGRRQRFSLPTLPVHHQSIDIDSGIGARNAVAERSKVNYDKHTRSLPPLSLDQRVVIQDPVSRFWSKEGVISGMRDGGLSYLVEREGRSYIRNKKFIRPVDKPRTRGKVRRIDLEDFHVVVDGVTVFPDKKLELHGVKFDSSFSTFPHGASVAASARQQAAMIARLSHHLPRGAYLQQLARGLVLADEPSSLNELTVHPVAMETWRAFHSQDGPDGSRNALGLVIFPSNVATRSTRSETAGVVSPHLPYAANTLSNNPPCGYWRRTICLKELQLRGAYVVRSNAQQIQGTVIDDRDKCPRVRDRGEGNHLAQTSRVDHDVQRGSSSTNCRDLDGHADVLDDLNPVDRRLSLLGMLLLLVIEVLVTSFQPPDATTEYRTTTTLEPLRRRGTNASIASQDRSCPFTKNLTLSTTSTTLF
eukprot:maker-scaffold1440_size41170-snap-gene-0.6 protein:Tk02758 transcript:maker-scaffold1440_size41170-snap-gene-0.6-mRNA-1 annotation:"PREDICTED: uncharacterized protein K02A2.6-like"